MQNTNLPCAHDHLGLDFYRQWMNRRVPYHRPSIPSDEVVIELYDLSRQEKLSRILKNLAQYYRVTAPSLAERASPQMKYDQSSTILSVRICQSTDLPGENEQGGYYHDSKDCPQYQTGEQQTNRNWHFTRLASASLIAIKDIADESTDHSDPDRSVACLLYRR